MIRHLKHLLGKVNWGVVGAVLFCLFAWLGLLAGVLHAQDGQLAPPGSLAFTECLGGHVKTFVDATIIGTDSMQEILVHEAKHREQDARTPGQCPQYTPWKLLADEVEAYCASRPYRVARGYTIEQADSNYLLRLKFQFDGAMPLVDQERAYHRGCPDVDQVPKQ